MDKKKVLSISIASYNVAEYLEHTVESLSRQNALMDRIEIIIVNDGSSDDTSTIAHQLQDRYPDSVVVVDKENGGYGSTINASLEIAKGKYYKLLDGDDWFASDAVEDFLRYLDECDADLVISPYYEVRDDEVLIDTHPEIPCGVTDLSELKFTNDYFGMHELTIRTEALRSLGMPVTEHCFYTDSEYVCYCFSSVKTISRFGKGVYCYRLGLEGQSVSLSGIRKHYRDHPVVLKKVYECYKKYADTVAAANRSVIENWITIITRNTYISYLLLAEAAQHRNELMEIDQSIKKEYPDLYPLGSRAKLVKGLRTFGFRPYWFWCRYAGNQYRG